MAVVARGREIRSVLDRLKGLGVYRKLLSHTPCSMSLCVGGPVCECGDCSAQGLAAVGECVGAGVVAQG